MNFQEFKYGLENLHIILENDQYNDVFQLLDKDKDGYLSFPEFSLISKGNLKEIKEYKIEVLKDKLPCRNILKSRLPKNVSVIDDLFQGKEPS